jgi:hypothetical protein
LAILEYNLMNYLAYIDKDKRDPCTGRDCAESVQVLQRFAERTVHPFVFRMCPARRRPTISDLDRLMTFWKIVQVHHFVNFIKIGKYLPRRGIPFL